MSIPESAPKRLKANEVSPSASFLDLPLELQHVIINLMSSIQDISSLTMVCKAANATLWRGVLNLGRTSGRRRPHRMGWEDLTRMAPKLKELKALYLLIAKTPTFVSIETIDGLQNLQHIEVEWGLNVQGETCVGGLLMQLRNLQSIACSQGLLNSIHDMPSLKMLLITSPPDTFSHINLITNDLKWPAIEFIRGRISSSLPDECHIDAKDMITLKDVELAALRVGSLADRESVSAVLKYMLHLQELEFVIIPHFTDPTIHRACVIAMSMASVPSEDDPNPFPDLPDRLKRLVVTAWTGQFFDDVGYCTFAQNLIEYSQADLADRMVRSPYFNLTDLIETRATINGCLLGTAIEHELKDMATRWVDMLVAKPNLSVPFIASAKADPGLLAISAKYGYVDIYRKLVGLGYCPTWKHEELKYSVLEGALMGCEDNLLREGCYAIIDHILSQTWNDEEKALLRLPSAFYESVRVDGGLALRHFLPRIREPTPLDVVDAIKHAAKLGINQELDRVLECFQTIDPKIDLTRHKKESTDLALCFMRKLLFASAVWCFETLGVTLNDICSNGLPIARAIFELDFAGSVVVLPPESFLRWLAYLGLDMTANYGASKPLIESIFSMRPLRKAVELIRLIIRAGYLISESKLVRYFALIQEFVKEDPVAAEDVEVGVLAHALTNRMPLPRSPYETEDPVVWHT